MYYAHLQRAKRASEGDMMLRTQARQRNHAPTLHAGVCVLSVLHKGGNRWRGISWQGHAIRAPGRVVGLGEQPCHQTPGPCAPPHALGSMRVVPHLSFRKKQQVHPQACVVPALRGWWAAQKAIGSPLQLKHTQNEAAWWCKGGAKKRW